MAGETNWYSSPSDFLRWAKELVIGVQRSTVIWPLMVVSLVIGLFALGAANFAKSELLQIADLLICAVCVASFIFAFYYFMFTDPEILRSERHGQVTRVLDIVEAKGNIVDVDPTTLVEQSEPRQLPGPATKD
jgi:hypothetical protein